MSLVSCGIMIVLAVRDRVGLMMTFVLPALLFLVFAAIFAGTGGKDLKLKIGTIDLVSTATTKRFLDALRADPSLRTIAFDGPSERPLVDAVGRGAVDIGLVLRADPEESGKDKPPPILIVENATRPLAANIGIGQVQRILNEKLPDVALARILADVERAGAIGKDERSFLTDAFHKEVAARSGDAFAFAQLIEREVASATGGNANVLHYAGAVVAVFLLISSSHAALIILDERKNGIAHRLMMSKGGATAVLFGKLLFLVAQGFVQVLVVYGVAFFVFGASFALPRTGLWLITSLLCSASASGLALAVVSACRNRHQAENVSTFGTLLVSALGGSMVPSYLMPPRMQDISWLTPNAWMIEALEQATRDGWPFRSLIAPWLVLAIIALAGFMTALVISNQRRDYF